MENPHYEAAPRGVTPENAYEQNHATLLMLMGRINGLLAANYRTNRPREWEHIGRQEEVIAILRGVAELLGVQ